MRRVVFAGMRGGDGAIFGAAAAGPVGQARFELTISPARAAYLIQAGSRAGLRRAACEATTRWGGATEPVLPVRRNGSLDPLWRQLVEVLRPAGLVNVDVEPSTALSLGVDLGLDVVPIDRIDREGRTMFCANPIAVWTPPAGGINDPALLATERRDLWEVVAAGDVTDEVQLWCRDHEVPVRRPRSVDEIARAQLWRTTALDRTTDQLPVRWASGAIPGMAVLWIVKPNAYRDLLWYWNYRALRMLGTQGRPMLLIPERGVEDWVEFDTALAGALRRPIVGTPDITICSVSVKQERLIEIARHLGLQLADEYTPTPVFQFPEPVPREPPYTCRMNLDPIQELVFDRAYGAPSRTLAQIYTDKTLVDIDSPVEVRRFGWRPWLRSDRRRSTHCPSTTQSVTRCCATLSVNLT